MLNCLYLNEAEPHLGLINLRCACDVIGGTRKGRFYVPVRRDVVLRRLRNGMKSILLLKSPVLKPRFLHAFDPTLLQNHVTSYLVSPVPQPAARGAGSRTISQIKTATCGDWTSVLIYCSVGQA